MDAVAVAQAKCRVSHLPQPVGRLVRRICAGCAEALPAPNVTAPLRHGDRAVTAIRQHTWPTAGETGTGRAPGCEPPNAGRGCGARKLRTPDAPNGRVTGCGSPENGPTREAGTGPTAGETGPPRCGSGAGDCRQRHHHSLCAAARASRISRGQAAGLCPTTSGAGGEGAGLVGGPAPLPPRSAGKSLPGRQSQEYLSPLNVGSWHWAHRSPTIDGHLLCGGDDGSLPKADGGPVSCRSGRRRPPGAGRGRGSGR
jgi:hypothetical protein